MTAAKRIAQFLKDHPDVPLRVVVGYTSIWGLAWLNRRTEGRQVDLLIGKTGSKYFEHGTREDRKDALEFLRRKDVSVYGWNKRIDDRSRTIMIAWHVDDGGHHLLAGSAHLSKQGLQVNVELMAEIAEDEVDASVKKMDGFFGEARDCKDLLLSYIGALQPAYRT